MKEETDTMTIEKFPLRPLRLRVLKAVLRPADTSTMTTPQVVALCEKAVPDCTIDEIIAALRQVAAEQMQEAAALERFHSSRRRPPAREP